MKIRGHRVDLNEIESRVAEHPRVKLAAILVREDTPGVKRLVAYAESDGGVEPRELREWCSETLAEYMVPSIVVLLDSFPQTHSGKIDRGKLPAPSDSPPLATAALRAPSTGMEELVASVWCEILNIPEVGVDQDFYDLGGDSILAIRIAAALHQHGYDFTVRDIFRNPTVVALASVLSADSTASTAPESAVWSGRIERAVLAARPQHDSRRRRQLSATPTILLTGATGYLGSKLAAGLLASTAARVVCLARGATGGVAALAEVRRRVSLAIASAYSGTHSEIESLFAERLGAVVGDLQLASLGLDPRSWDESLLRWTRSFTLALGCITFTHTSDSLRQMLGPPLSCFDCQPKLAASRCALSPQSRRSCMRGSSG